MILATLFALLATAEPISGGQRTVAVLPFEVQGSAGAWEGVALADALTDHVAQVNRDNFISLRQVAALLRRRGLDLSDPQAAVAKEVARPLGATALVTGTVTRSGDRCEIEAHLVRVSDGEELAAGKVEGAHAAIPVLSRQLGQKLFGATTRAPLLARDAAALELAAQCDALTLQQPLDPRSRGSLEPSAAARAERACRAALEKDSELGLAHAGLSVLLAARKNFPEALAEAKLAAKGRFVAEAALAEQFAARRSGDAARAHAILEEAVAAHPGFLIALAFLGEERFDARDDVGAAAAWDRYLARAPGHPWASAQKAHALAHLGKTGEAVALTRAALEAAPGDLDLSIELASRLIDAGKDAEAEPLLRAAAAASPSRPRATLRLGYLLLRGGKADEAGPLFQRVLTEARSADESRTRAVAHADLARVAAQHDDAATVVKELAAARAEGMEALPCAEPAFARWKQRPELAALCAPVKTLAPAAAGEDEAAAVDF